MRRLYTWLLYLLAPAVLLRLRWRARRQPEYQQRWGERFGYYAGLAAPPPGGIWLHTVSVGEFQAALPLIAALRERYPGQSFIITTTTPTGSAQVRARLGESVFHVYSPYDLPGGVRRFLRWAQPRLGLLMETELWPNLIAACAERSVPLLLVNARLSPRSARGYACVGALTRPTVRALTWIAAQTAGDAQRLVAIGADPARLSITGNLKFDLQIAEDLPIRAQALRVLWGKTRPVWIAASTHAGEEILALTAHRKVRAVHPEALLVLVPRHPERATEILAQSAAMQLSTLRRGALDTAPPDTARTAAVLLVDTLGELLLFYACADVALVGGSLIPRGGHNVIEPAALALPILVGPHTFNFADITAQLVAAGGAQRVFDAATLTTALLQFFASPAQARAAGEAACALVAANRGSVARTVALCAAQSESTAV